MDNFDEIKNIWETQKDEKAPSFKQISKAIKRYQSQRKKKIVSLIALSILCLTAMGYVMVDYHSHLWTTRIGEILFLLVGIYLLYFNLNLFTKKKHEEMLNTNDYLDVFKKNSKREVMNESRPLLFIIASVAFFLYVYEILFDSKTQLIIGYSILIAFLAIMWFVVRPRQLKRKLTKIQKLLDKIDTINTQSNE